MSYYGWVNSITICGWVGHSPHSFRAKSGAEMVAWDVFVPRFNVLPLREGEAREPFPPMIIKCIAGQNMINVMNKKRLNKGDVIIVTGALMQITKNVGKSLVRDYFIQPNNITILKGYRGMRAIEYSQRNEMIYNELLKEINGDMNDTSDTTGNDSNED